MLDQRAQSMKIVRGAAPNGNVIAVSTLLALLQKEGILLEVPTFNSSKQTVDEAKTQARDRIYNGKRGCYDFFLVEYNAAAKDNLLIDDRVAASNHFITGATNFQLSIAACAIEMNDGEAARLNEI